MQRPCACNSGKITGTEMNKTQSLRWRISKADVGDRHKTTATEGSKYYDRDMFILSAAGSQRNDYSFKEVMTFAL